MLGHGLYGLTAGCNLFVRSEQLFARAGFAVVLFDIDDALLQACLQPIKEQVELKVI